MINPLTADFMSLFTGHDGAYGLYSIPSGVPTSGKIKGSAASLKGKVTAELWQKHLDGEQGLGIIPINDDSCVRFGAIDIDEYPLDLVSLARDIEENDLPLVVARTKSGGAHLYMFMNDWTEAKLVHTRLRDFAAFLGRGTAEIYPKQTQILASRGDIGQWINMPYFDAYKSERYALGKKGERVSPEVFVERAKEKTITADALKAIQIEIPETLIGGPPCINHIVRDGFPEGTRNNGLFNLGVYAQKAFPDAWEAKLNEYNNLYMAPALGASEVVAVVKSLKKKQYFYTCNVPPIANHCNKGVCRKCKFGIGDGDLGMPVFGTLTKVLTVPPTWFLDIENGGRLQLETDDLQSPMRFQLKCMEALNVMPMVPKRETWHGIVSKLMENVHVVQVPRDSSPQDLLMQLLQEFLTSRVQANRVEEILLGKPWKNGKYYYFRFRDFLAFLDRKKFFAFKMHQITVYLQDRAMAESKFLNVNKSGVNLLMVPTSLFAEVPAGLEIPEIKSSEEY